LDPRELMGQLERKERLALWARPVCKVRWVSRARRDRKDRLDPKGLTGRLERRGPQGAIGPMGATGATGAQGEMGLPGATGATGPQGVTGDQGAMGPPGDGLTHGAILYMPAGSAAPAGFTKIGTLNPDLKIKDLNGHPQHLEIDVYQHN
ncbi:MAG: hypothetical protein ACRD5Z_16480, partial [Bryobacteraceae bacterium]